MRRACQSGGSLSSYPRRRHVELVAGNKCILPRKARFVQVEDWLVDFDGDHDASIRAAAFDWLAAQVAIHGDVLPRATPSPGV